MAIKKNTFNDANGRFFCVENDLHYVSLLIFFVNLKSKYEMKSTSDENLTDTFHSF